MYTPFERTKGTFVSVLFIGALFAGKYLVFQSIETVSIIIGLTIVILTVFVVFKQKLSAHKLGN